MEMYLGRHPPTSYQVQPETSQISDFVIGFGWILGNRVCYRDVCFTSLWACYRDRYHKVLHQSIELMSCAILCSLWKNTILLISLMKGLSAVISRSEKKKIGTYYMKCDFNFLMHINIRTVMLKRRKNIRFFFFWQSLQKLFMYSHILTCILRYIFLKPIELFLSKSFRMCVCK